MVQLEDMGLHVAMAFKELGGWHQTCHLYLRHILVNFCGPVSVLGNGACQAALKPLKYQWLLVEDWDGLLQPFCLQLNGR